MSIVKFKELKLKYDHRGANSCKEVIGISIDECINCRCLDCLRNNMISHYESALRTGNVTCTSIATIQRVLGNEFCEEKTCDDCSEVLIQILKGKFKDKFDDLKRRRDELRKV